MVKCRQILIAGWLFPFVLVSIFFWKGRQYDPAFFEPPAATGSSLPVPLSLAGWLLEGGEAFSADRMYEKINGRADYYLQYGASGLYCGEWASDRHRWDMYLYEFADARGARGAFSGERPAEFRLLDSLDGYTVPGQVAAIVGTFYLQLSAQQIGSDLETARNLAEKIIHHLGGPDSEPHTSEAERTPAVLAGEMLVPGSEGFLLENAFGFSALHNVQIARVVLDGVEALWFGAEGGKEALAEYVDELTQYGGEEIFTQAGGVGGSMFGTWEVVEVAEKGLWGVRDVESKEDLLRHWRALQGAREGREE